MNSTKEYPEGMQALLYEWLGDAPLISTYFYISGSNYDPDEIEKVTGISATGIIEGRKKLLREPHVDGNFSWRLGLKKRPCYSVDDAVSEVLELVSPIKERFQPFMEDAAFDVGIISIVWIDVSEPVYDLKPGTMTRLAELGCEFDLDIFNYGFSVWSQTGYRATDLVTPKAG